MVAMRIAVTGRIDMARRIRPATTVPIAVVMAVIVPAVIIASAIPMTIVPTPLAAMIITAIPVIAVVVAAVIRTMLLVAAIVVRNIVEGWGKNGAGDGCGSGDKRDQKSSECRAFHDLSPRGPLSRAAAVKRGAELLSSDDEKKLNASFRIRSFSWNLACRNRTTYQARFGIVAAPAAPPAREMHRNQSGSSG
jgi:hypothetical protein